ncbi:MAG TPA: peptidoglycan DD-metalloendopeptidase family protein [Methylomirabilota bacterium]|nr:peptidoglycan DD-metalloendopeptidase family protein [Methylomirabilota bacterium]
MSRRSRLKLWFIAMLLLIVIGGASYLTWRQSVPGVRVTGAPARAIGSRTPVTLVVEAARGNVSRTEVRVVQGEAVTVVGRYEGRPTPRVEVVATLAPGSGVREGAGSLEVWATDDFWRPFGRAQRAAASFPVVVDFTPPKLEVVAATPYVAPGGAGLVVVQAGDAIRAETRVATLSFPTFAFGSAGLRVGLFALPHDFTRGSALTVNAQDEAGNTATRGIGTEVLPRRFRRDTIEVTDALLQMKVAELLPQHPAGRPLVEGFLTINRDQRRQAEEEKRRLAAKTADRPLWDGAFVQPKNTKVFSNFAETRTYRYQGREIDTQIHFGYDLASTKQAPVPAANNGTVVFAGPLTIYGNTIIIDHGLGLMTLYGHLSRIGVKVGDDVSKGQEIGRTGTTGLATGDHLHYEVLIQGVSVTPLEWWDGKWVRDRIGGPLASAGARSPAKSR